MPLSVSPTTLPLFVTLAFRLEFPAQWISRSLRNPNREAAKDQFVRIDVLNVACDHDRGRLRPKFIVTSPHPAHGVARFDDLEH
jgi:hypothetical protein